MPNYGQDLNIGIPQETTLKDIHDKLDELEKKVDAVKDGIDESVNVQKTTKIISELILGQEVDEEE